MVLLVVRPHLLADYRYLFSANAYTGITAANSIEVLLNVVRGGMWTGRLLYPLALTVVLACIALRALRQEPVAITLVLWALGYGGFLAYHNNNWEH